MIIGVEVEVEIEDRVLHGVVEALRIVVRGENGGEMVIDLGDNGGGV